MIVTHKLLDCNDMIVTHKLVDCNEIIVTHKLLDCNEIIAGPREARNPNLDSDQRISYYACVACL